MAVPLPTSCRGGGPGTGTTARGCSAGEVRPAGYGLWRNPLGRWDWWDLDGRIAGERRRSGRAASVVSAGPNQGRAVLTNLENTLTSALGSEPPAEVVVEADNNLEMVSRLLEDAQAGREHAFPGAILLPPGSVEDATRSLRPWPEFEPEATLAWLGLPAKADGKRSSLPLTSASRRRRLPPLKASPGILA